MSRSFTQLRRVLPGTSCAIVCGFGGAELLATPRIGASDHAICTTHPECELWCNEVPGYDQGYCDIWDSGECVCWNP